MKFAAVFILGLFLAGCLSTSSPNPTARPAFTAQEGGGRANLTRLSQQGTPVECTVTTRDATGRSTTATLFIQGESTRIRQTLYDSNARAVDVDVINTIERDSQTGRSTRVVFTKIIQNSNTPTASAGATSTPPESACAWLRFAATPPATGVLPADDTLAKLNANPSATVSCQPAHFTPDVFEPDGRACDGTPTPTPA